MAHKSKIILCLGLFIMLSLNTLTHAAEQLEDRLNRIVEEYMNTKNALLHDRTDLSGPWAERLETTLATTPNDLFSEDLLPEWQAYQATMIDALGDMVESDDIEVHREALGRLSADLKDLLVTLGHTMDLYVFTCNDIGNGDVIWLNDSERVANPYHGQENSNCGDIVERL